MATCGAQKQKERWQGARGRGGNRQEAISDAFD